MTFDQLIQEIKEYESNTFFAKGCNLTNVEAIKLAEMCIDCFVNYRLDGVLLDHFLYNLRGETK
jgi:hypothetical protein